MDMSHLNENHSHYSTSPASGEALFAYNGAILFLKVLFIVQPWCYSGLTKEKEEENTMNENTACTTSSSIQTLTGLLYILAFAVTLAVVLCVI